MRSIAIIRRMFLLLSLSGLFNVVLAMTCNPVQVKMQNKSIILLGPEKSENPQIYFFKNSSKQAIWIDHPTHRSMSAGWSSYLRVDHWSAFLLTRKDFEITCSVIEPGKVENLSCVQALLVCSPSKVVFKNPPKDTYWLVEDKPWEELIKVVEKHALIK